MRKQDIIKELKKLNSIQANEEWKNSFQDILFNQISSQQTVKKNFSYYLGYLRTPEILFPYQLKQVVLKPISIAVLCLAIKFSTRILLISTRVLLSIEFSKRDNVALLAKDTSRPTEV